MADCVAGLDGSGEWYRGLLKLLQGGTEEAVAGLNAANLMCLEWAHWGGGLGREREREIGRCVGDILQQIEQKHAVALIKAASDGGESSVIGSASKFAGPLALIKVMSIPPSSSRIILQTAVPLKLLVVLCLELMPRDG